MNKRFFDDLLVAKGMSLRQLAKRMDMLPSQLSLMLNGKRRMQMAEAVRMSQLLGAPLNEILLAAGINEAVGRRCKIVGILAGDGLVHKVEEGAIERVMMPDGLPDHTVAVQARTAESPLAWMDGWVLFVNGEREPVEMVDRFCLVTLEDGRRLFATIRRGYTTGTFNLSGTALNNHSFNTLTDQRVTVASPVLMTKH